MEPFPFERLPIELKINIIRFAIPPITVYGAISCPPYYFVCYINRRYGKELSRVRTSCPEIKAICDRIRYLVVCLHGREVYRLDPLRDTFFVDQLPKLLDVTQVRRDPRWEPSLQAGFPIRRMVCRTAYPRLSRGAPALQAGGSPSENGEQTYAQMPFNSSLPIWRRTPMLKDFILIIFTCGRNWHIESFQQYGPSVSGWRSSDNHGVAMRNNIIEEGYDRFESTDSQAPQSDTGIQWRLAASIGNLSYPGDGAVWADVPRIGFHGYSRGDMSQGGKWAGFRYWTETNKIEFRPLSWSEVQPCIEDLDYQGISMTHSHPDFIARLWVNRPGQPKDVEQSQYGWIEVKAPEEGDAPWVEQVATTWKMVRDTLVRMNEAMDFDWHLENE